MKRIIMMVLRNLLFVPYGWFKLCWYASHVDRYTEEERYALLKYIDGRANRGEISLLMLMGQKIFQKKMASCFIRIIRDFMMCWQFWTHVRFLFLLWRKRKWERFLFEAGICMYESLYY